MFPSSAIIILTIVIQPKLISGAIPVGFKSLLKCKEYYTATYEHPPTSDFIFPDQEISKTSTRKQPAKLSKYPFTAIAVNVEDNTYCGGTLISERFILVTAVCAHNKTVEVILNDADFTLTNTTIRHAVKRQIRHPGFKSKPSYNDIGLLELDKPVTFSEHLRPACIKTSRARDDGEVGWFLTAWIRDSSSEFRLVRIPGSEVNNEKCQNVRQDERRSPYGIISHLQICIVETKYWTVFDYEGEFPMTLMTRNKQYESYAAIGIPSVGIPIPTTTPQIYTRISGYIGWLESVVWPEEPISGCNKFIFDRNI